MKKVVSLIVVIVLMLTVVSTVSAKKSGPTASIKGPDVVYMGKRYRYTVFCQGGDTFYTEVGYMSRVVSPKIISGSGTLYYEPEKYPAWFGWVGDPTSNFKSVFFIVPDTLGTHRLWISCYDQTAYDAKYIDVAVLPRKR